MGWTTPRTWTTSEIVTKAIMDTHVRDNLEYLKAVLTGGTTQDVTLAGKLISTAKSHQLGTAASGSISAPTQADANLLLYNFTSGNWAGVGIDGGGNFWLRTGLTGTPEARLAILASGEVLASVAGSAGAPAIARITDQDTGLLWPAANELSVATGGTERVRVTSAGVLAQASPGVGYGWIGTAHSITYSGVSGVNLNPGGSTRVQVYDTASLYGESAPYVYVTGARLAVDVDSVVPLIVNRGVNDGIVISIRQGGTEEGYVSVAGTVLTFQTFLGAHPTQLKAGQEEPPLGGVVVTTGELVRSDNTHYIEDVVEPEPAPEGDRKRGVTVRQVRHDKRQGPGSDAWREVRGETKDYLPHVAGTTVEGDPAVYGIWHGMVKDDAAGGSFGKNGQPVYSVAGVGTFECRVTDSGGDIAAGDLLCASARMYEAQRQGDDVIRAGTLGKALSGVRWDDVPIDRALGYRWRLVSVALYCG